MARAPPIGSDAMGGRWRGRSASALLQPHDKGQTRGGPRGAERTQPQPAPFRIGGPVMIEPPGIEARLAAHVDSILNGASFRKRDRQDLSEEMYRHLWQRWQDALASG